jgi:hypothetical protein
MNYLRSTLIVTALVIVLFLVISISGNYVEAPTLPDQNATSSVPDQDDVPVIPGNKTVVYSFEATLPTPCHRLSEPDVLIRESYPEQVAVEYDVLPPKADVMCAQVVTTTQITDSVQMPASAIFSSVSVDGTSVAFTILR